MEQQFKVSEIIEDSLRFYQIFVNAIEKFSTGELFTRPERLYMHDVFEVWIKDNGNCLDQLSRLLDADGKLLEGQEEALDTLYYRTKATCTQAEKFEKDFEVLYLKRARLHADIEEVRALFVISQN